MDRIVILIDMDCFYVQVEQRYRPETSGKPCAVAQYNGATGGGIIAVSYEAREKGVKRGMWGKTARACCPDLILFEVPEKRGKADLIRYRMASTEVFKCITDMFENVERASIDEAFIDITNKVSSVISEGSLPDFKLHHNSETFYAIGASSIQLNVPEWADTLLDQSADGLRYAVASILTFQLRQAILSSTGFRCSAGVAPNKTLAKLACSLNKPNKQTLVLPEYAAALLHSTSIKKVRNLGGKLGEAVSQAFGCETIGDLAKIELSRITELFGDKTAQWLHGLCQGYDPDSVTSRNIAKSIGCSKNFPGQSMLTCVGATKKWLQSLVNELLERLLDDRQTNNRHPTRLSLHLRLNSPSNSETTSIGSSFSRVLPSAPLLLIGRPASESGNEEGEVDKTYNEKDLMQKIVRSAIDVIRELLSNGEHSEHWTTGITCLALSAGKFSPDTANTSDIRTLFTKQQVITKRNAIDTVESTGCTNSIPQDENSATFDNTSFFKRFRVRQCTEPSQMDKAVESTLSCKVTETPPKVLQAVSSTNTAKPSFASSEDDNDSRNSSKSESNLFFTSCSTGDWTICDQCGSRISVWNFPEHADFHLAQQIQHQWASESSSTARLSSPSKPKPTPPVRSRERKPKSNVVATTCHTLDRFFIKSSR